jgi:hypothetical protein
VLSTEGRKEIKGFFSKGSKPGIEACRDGIRITIVL